MGEDNGHEVPPPREEMSWLERRMFQHVPVWILLLFALLAALGSLLFGALVLDGARGGSWRPFNMIAMKLAGAPSILLRGPPPSPWLSPPGAEVLPAGFYRPAGAPTDLGHLLLTRYDSEKDERFISLVRLSDGVVLREYRPDLKPIDRIGRSKATPATHYPSWSSAPRHPYLMEDGGLLFMAASFMMARTDACDRTVWSKSGGHHSIERDHAGNIWTPATLAVDPSRDLPPTFMDDGLVQTSPNGEELYSRSLSRIFADNGLDALISGAPYRDDPFHLNDIEPVLEDGPYWKRGDVFLSLRHLSMLILFRPFTGKVVWWKIGPWLAQHDVVVLDESRIAIFDNRAELARDGGRVRGVSRELIYDFRYGSVTSPWEAGFRELALRVPSNGRGLPLPGGDILVEDTVHGQIVRFGPDGAVRWRYVQADAKGRRYWMFWSRYLPPEHYAAAIRATLERRCN